MEPREQFKYLLKVAIGPLLKGHGFSRSRQTFHRRIRRNWTVINFQKSSKTDREQVVFTVNLGVASALLTEFDGGDPERRPAEHDCHFRERLGFLLPDPRDHWWVLDAETRSPEHLARTLGRHLTTIALPYLERHAGDEAIRDLWLETKHYDWVHLSVLLKILGRRRRRKRCWQK